jgi:hypothetical protein
MLKNNVYLGGLGFEAEHGGDGFGAKAQVGQACRDFRLVHYQLFVVNRFVEQPVPRRCTAKKKKEIYIYMKPSGFRRGCQRAAEYKNFRLG